MPGTNPPHPAPGFKDRSGLLVFVGIMEICLGTLCAGGAALMLLMAFVTRDDSDLMGPPVDTGVLVTAVLTYLAPTGFLVCMGVGTIKGRRWARSLMLIVLWPWLLCGLFGIALLCLVLPALLSQNPSAGAETSEAMMSFAMTAVIVISAVPYVVLPVLLLLFYGGRNVKATFATKDPNPGWTERRPLSVIGLSLAMGAFGLLTLLALPYGTFLVFGWVLTGPPAAVAILLVAGLCVLLARATYRITPAAWWANVAFVVLSHLSAFVSFRRVSLGDLCARMGLDPQDLLMLRPFEAGGGLDLSWLTAASGALWLLGLVLLRRHFFARPPAS
jgi:hypothetical protein